MGIRDTVHATVTGSNRHGCYVVLDEQVEGITDGFYFGCGTAGDRVMLSIKRVDTDRESVLCDLDAVISYGEIRPRYAAA